MPHKSHKVMLRRNPNRWPPLHSPLVWQKHIPDRTAMALYRVGGGPDEADADPPLVRDRRGRATTSRTPATS